MTYNFKDLMALGPEAIGNGTEYRDYTNINESDIPAELKGLAPDQPTAKLATWILEKGIGKDVRLALALAVQWMNVLASKAKQVAERTQTRQDNLEDQTAQDVAQMEADKDAVIANATVDSEVILARGGKPTLGARLDDTTAQLAQTEQQIMDFKNDFKLRSPIRFGEIKMPSDFYNINFKLFRRSDGKVYHDIDFDARWRNYKIQEVIYVDTDNGKNREVDGADGSAENPYQTPAKAFEKIEQSSRSRFKVVISGKQILRNEFIITPDQALNFENKFIVITTKDNKPIPVIIGDTSHRQYAGVDGYQGSQLSWELESGDVYKTTRSNTNFVVDTDYRDLLTGETALMVEVSSIAECQALRGSYYIDGSIVYVHTYNGRPADGSVGCVLFLTTKSVLFNISDGTLFLENIEFSSEKSVEIIGNINSTFVHNDVELVRSNSNNGLNARDIGQIYGFYSAAHDTLRDGFNYHYQNIPENQRRNCFVFEYYLIAYRNGVDDSNSNNNATSAHGGVNILRVGDIGEKSRGVVCADVNGCYSVLIDCNMSESLLPASNYRSASYQFTTDVSTTSSAKAVLINCGGVSDAHSIIIDEGTELVLESWFEGTDKILHL